jgi:hypothetical protein
MVGLPFAPSDCFRVREFQSFNLDRVKDYQRIRFQLSTSMYFFSFSLLLNETA